MCTAHRVGRGSAAAVLGILVMALAGCQLGAQPQAVSSLTMTSPAASSALVVVADSDAGPALSRLVAASARPDEQIDVLGDGAPAPVLVAASAPGPVAVTVSRRPISPGTGATSFQRAEYQRSLDRWQRSVAATEQAAHRRTRAALAAWSSSLGIEVRIGGCRRPGRQPDWAASPRRRRARLRILVGSGRASAAACSFSSPESRRHRAAGPADR